MKARPGAAPWGLKALSGAPATRALSDTIRLSPVGADLGRQIGPLPMNCSRLPV
jgi:hypothetical protein